MPPKKNKNDYMFRKRSNETLEKLPGVLNGSDFAIMLCTNCEIYIYDHLAQVFVDDCTDCKVFLGPTSGSVFVRDCKNVEVHCAAGQFRVSDTQNITAYVYSQSDPALENVKNLRIAPYNFIYPDVSKHFVAAKLDPKLDKWSQVFDFTPGKDERNWQILEPQDFPGPVVRQLDGIEGDMRNPAILHRAYGGDSDEPIIVGSQDPTSREEGGGMMSFSIQVGAKAAAEEFQQHQDQAQTAEGEQQQIAAPIANSVEQATTGNSPAYGGNSNFQQLQEFEAHSNNRPNEDQDIFGAKTASLDITMTTSQQPQNEAQQWAWEDPHQNSQQQQQQDQQYFGEVQSSPYDYQPQDTQFGATTHLQQIEKEITARIIQAQENERLEKQKRAQNARAWLEQFERDRQNTIAKQKQLNRELESRQKANSVEQGSWSKIKNNISLKPGDFTGSKDVTRMREALVNRQSDEAQKK